MNDKDLKNAIETTKKTIAEFERIYGINHRYVKKYKNILDGYTREWNARMIYDHLYA